MQRMYVVSIVTLQVIKFYVIDKCLLRIIVILVFLLYVTMRVQVITNKV